MNTYRFQISAYDIDRLLPQVSQALKKRTDLLSRQQYPSLWAVTDKLNSAGGGKKRSTLRTRFMSILCLILGVILFVPGLMKPQELLVPLLAGAVAIGAGLGGLWRSRKKKQTPFDRSAKLLLQGKDSLGSEFLSVDFSDDGMTIPSEKAEAELIPYFGFECAIETADALLLVYDTRVTLLQKCDLKDGKAEDFCSILSKKVVEYHVL